MNSDETRTSSINNIKTIIHYDFLKSLFKIPTGYNANIIRTIYIVLVYGISVLILSIYIYTISMNAGEKIHKDKGYNTKLELSSLYKTREDKLFNYIYVACVLGVLLLITIILLNKNYDKFYILKIILLFFLISPTLIIISIIAYLCLIYGMKTSKETSINILLICLYFIYSSLAINQSIPFLDLPHNII